MSLPIALKPSEQIVATARRYLLTAAPWFALAAGLILAPFFFMFWLFAQGVWGAAVFVASVAIAAFVLFRTLWLWQRNTFYVTNDRVIDVDQRGFFNRIVSEAPYEKVHDISYRIEGVLQTAFGYGTVVVQTASGNVHLDIPRIRHPERIQAMLTDLRSKFLARTVAPTGRATILQVLASIEEMGEEDLRTLERLIAKRLEVISSTTDARGSSS